MMMGGTASQDGNLACIVVIYLIRKSSPNLNRQLYANGTSFLLNIKKKSAQVISFTANVFAVFKSKFSCISLICYFKYYKPNLQQSTQKNECNQMYFEFKLNRFFYKF